MAAPKNTWSVWMGAKTIMLCTHPKKQLKIDLNIHNDPVQISKKIFTSGDQLSGLVRVEG